MIETAETIRSEAISILQKSYNFKMGNAITINARNGHNPAILAAIAYYKSLGNVAKTFPTQWSDEDLFWFYDQLKYDKHTGTKTPTIALTLLQVRELTFTLFRYWNFVHF